MVSSGNPNIKNEFMKNNGLSSIDKWIFYIVILDVLFFPYIRILKASLSMLILPIWYLFNMKRIIVTKEMKLFFVMLFFVLSSLFLSFIFHPRFMMSNITNTIILIYGFLYYFFFLWSLKRNDFTIRKFLFAYVVFVSSLAGLYFVNPSLYFQVRSLWTMGTNSIEVNNSLLMFRFTSTFSDPNNLASIINAILLFVMMKKEEKVNNKIIIVIASAFIVTMTMSSTGYVLFGIFLIFYTLSLLIRIIKRPRIRKATIWIVLLCLLILPMIYVGIEEFLSNDIAKLSLSRLESNSLDSRLLIWRNLIENKNMFIHMFFGDGGTIILNDNLYRPHNGHFHVIYNYGFISYLIFLYIFFRVRPTENVVKNGLFLIPLFLGFTINVGIYEPRFTNLMALLVATYSAYSEK